MTDPRGIESETFYDLLGRTTRTVTAWDGSSDETSSTPVVGSDDNQVTDYTYDGDNHTLTQTAWNKNGTNAATFQITAYVYGVTTTGGSAIDSNDLLAKVEYPNATTGYAGTSAASIVAYSYNALGQQTTMTDRNNTTHEYSYDPLGRLITDDVTHFGTHVNDTVGMITYAYNDAGLLYQSTNYDDDVDLDAEGEEERIYDGFGNLIADYQSTTSVDTSTSPEVQYVYDFSDNHDRLSEMIYPNGRVLHYGYDNNTLDDAISRVDYLADDDGTGSVGQHLVDYSYLGLSTVVIEDRPEEGVELTYVKQSGDTLAGGDGGDQYTGLDQFGRVIDQNWINTSTGDTVDRTQYGYDMDGNVLYERNLGPGSGSSSLSILDTYDDLNRLTSYEQGTLNSNGTAITTASTLANNTESWNLDSQGNWSSEDVDGTTTDRTNNDDNQITADGSASPTYDNNGNMTSDGSGNSYSYDAWNRIAAMTNATTGIEIYLYLPGNDQAEQYDILGSGPTVSMVYSDSGQVLQETDHQHSGAITQYVWGTTYVNDLILRDRDSDDNTSTGSYGKTATTGSGTTGLDERLYVLQDANYDVTAITDVSGSVQERFNYDPYGNVTVLNSSASSAITDSYSWLYRYQGGRLDPTSSLYTFGARNYDPSLGRWMQQDPAGYVDGADLYQFVDGDPVKLVDPLGRDAMNNPAGLGLTSGMYNSLVSGAYDQQNQCPPPPATTPPADPDDTIGDVLEYLFADGQYNPLPLLDHWAVGGFANFIEAPFSLLTDAVTMPVRAFTHRMDNEPLCTTQTQEAFNEWYYEAWENFLHGPDKSQNNQKK